ncbi:hypothetical protein LC605_03505 [Nostoc sp. CHAB 5836]|uniref:hypothetical protein n=1 Tax=Nostoc sp. CHAB 5836 TaxID=2780404 RepID=UPI001E5AFA68|nr:hypothetical protein [Nostoc sp. CHAB 5836]MCC5614157.1 hypothetical protein [Nostoc sp. CHAB 5836]
MALFLVVHEQEGESGLDKAHHFTNHTKSPGVSRQNDAQLQGGKLGSIPNVPFP